MSDDHGPAGTDGGASGFSAGFTSAAGPAIGGAPLGAAAPVSGPVFGRAGEEEFRREQQAEWRSSFDGPETSKGRLRSSPTGSFVAQLFAVGSSMIGLVAFAFIAYTMGMDLWWIFLGVGIPLVSRTIRILRQNLRD